ncbi:MAG: lipopolysaccharide biosynthesis protein [Bacteroidota bacterium]
MQSLRRILDNESLKLLKNSSWVLFANFYSTGLAFLRSVFIARGLGASLFGSYAIIVSFVGMIQEFLNLNLGTALIRYGAGYQAAGRNDKLKALVVTCLRVSGVMLLVSVLVIIVLLEVDYRQFISSPGLETYVIAYALAAGITYFNSISRSLLRLHYRFRISSLIEMVMDTCETAAVAWVVWFHPKSLEAFFPTLIAVRFLNGFICNLAAFRELSDVLDVAPDDSGASIKEDLSSIRNYVLVNSLGNTLKTLISQGDVLLLGLLASPVEVAFYVVAKKSAYAVLTLSDPLTSSVFPQLSKLLAERRYSDVKTMLKRVTLVGAVPAVIFFVTMLFLNKWLLITVYGKEYAESSASFMYFLTGALLGALTFWTLPLVQSLGIVRLRVVAYLTTIIIGAGLSFLLVPGYGARGMAIALLVTNILNATIFILSSFRTLHKAETEGKAVI